MRFRFHLMAFAAATTLPLLVLALVLSIGSARDQRMALERQARDNARALQLAVDRELGVVLATVTSLGTSPTVDGALTGGDTRPFLRQARAIVGQRPSDIQALVLYRPDGQQIANSQRPAGAPLPHVRDLRAASGRHRGGRILTAALADGRPRITGLFWAPVPRRWMIGFVAPIMRDGRAIGAIAGNITPDSISQVLKEQMLPPGWVAGVADEQGLIVARSRDAALFVGKRSPNAVVPLDQVVPSTTVDGRQVYSAVQQLSLAPWRVGCAAPAAAFEGILGTVLTPLVGGGLVLVGLALAGALVIGRGLGAEIEALGRLDSGGDGRITEVAAARRALAAAAQATADRLAERQREVEHQRLLSAELSHRVKNALAVVQSMMLQTLRGAASLPAFAQDFQGRLAAYATAHDLLLASNWRDVDLGALVRTELAPFLAEGGAVTIDGPALPLDDRRGVALALIVHELATNAAKYGALSVSPPLPLAVAWTVTPTAAGRRVVLHWRERSPTPPSLAAPGFGTRLIRQSATHDLKGEAEVQIDGAALGWTLRFLVGSEAPAADRLAA